jgi:hypothetical protein
MKWRAFFPVILIVFLVGCRLLTIDIFRKETDSSTYGKGMAINTATLVSLPFITEDPTMEKTTSKSMEISETWTPNPTLTNMEAQQFVQDLLLSNRGCRLPCWWGITPGKTSWVEASHFLSAFAKDIEQGEEGQVIKDGITYEATNYAISYDISETESSGVMIDLRDNIVSKIVVGSKSTSQKYKLHQILSEYGQPEEIYIVTHSNVPDGTPPFTVVLFYPEYQFMADFTTEAKKQDDYMIGCPQTVSPRLILWGENRDISFNDLNKMALGTEPSNSLEKLEDVTTLNTESFYQVFRDSENTECISTLAEFW